MVEIVNQVETWNGRIEPESADPESIVDGRRYQGFRFSGRFSIDAIDMRHSPFENVVLPVVFETRPELFTLANAAVQLKPDSHLGSLTGDYSELAGYSLKSNWVVEGQNLYAMSDRHRDEIYSQLTFRVAFGSQAWPSFMKWILPLLIVMSIVLLAPSLESSLGEMRLAIPSTALLTLAYSLAGLGIAVVNDFKSIEGDRALGLASLPVVFGAKRASWISAAMINLFQLAMVGVLIAIGQHFSAVLLVLLIVPQMTFQDIWLLRDPVAFDVKYQASAQPFLVIGMLVTALAIGHSSLTSGLVPVGM
jgi:hypothetical protein